MNVSATCLGLDSYLLPRQERLRRGLSGYDPRASDLNAAVSDIESWLAGNPIEYFTYDHALGARKAHATYLSPTDVLIVEGVHATHSLLAPYLGLSIFLFASEEQLVEIRREADLNKRKMTVEESIQQQESELQAYNRFVHPYKSISDICVYLERKWAYRLA